MASNSNVVAGDSPILIKISKGETIRKFKLPLKDLTPDVLPKKLTSLIGLPADAKVTFERFSDSAGGYVTLDTSKPAVYKTLVRAAKAKLKLRLRATVEEEKPNGFPILKDTSSKQEMAAGAATSLLSHQPELLGSRNAGAGIFDFKNARTVEEDRVMDERMAFESAPVPHSFLASDPHDSDAGHFIHPPEPTLKSVPKAVSVRTKPKHPSGPLVGHGPTWSVYCNLCDDIMQNEHFHCSTCDGGDFDICQRCVDAGQHCPGEGHWLVKRYIKNGQMASSTTERLPPKPEKKTAAMAIHAALAGATGNVRLGKLPSTSANTASGAIGHAPAAHASACRFAPAIAKPDVSEEESKTTSVKGFVGPTRTCNSCIDVLPEGLFVTCKSCDDYDLCLRCHTANKHGHHPAHSFATAVSGRLLNDHQQALAAPGRATRHYAICDGCDKNIQGVRHKCFDCPDFDYCNDCIRAAHLTHAGHRFAPLYEQLSAVDRPAIRHTGIFCDGPACLSKSRQTYITGVRYKCAICHDRDYCANCEASPNNPHDKSHPLVKISSPIHGLEITTRDDVRAKLDFVPAQPVVQRSTKPVVPASTASTVKTVAHTEPSPPRKEATTSHTIETPPTVYPMVFPVQKSAPEHSNLATGELQALFVYDTIPDGITVRADSRFTQVWTLYNPGPMPWPVGCSVRFVGGDNMLNMDRSKPFSASAMMEASESNVTGRLVKPGEKVAFKVVLKAPLVRGKAISYWRLNTADGIPFGHRLWCDINVNMGTGPMISTANDVDKPRDTPFKILFDKHMLLNKPRTGPIRRHQKDDQVDLLQLLGKNNCEVNSQPTFRETQIRRNLATHMATRRAYFQRKVEEMHNASQDSTGQAVAAGPSSETKTPRSMAVEAKSAPVEVKAIPVEVKPSAVESKPTTVEAESAPAGSEPTTAQVQGGPVEIMSAPNEVKSSAVEAEFNPFAPLDFPRLSRPASPAVTQSLMIYPTLDKESPASSMHFSGKGKAATVEDEETGAILSAERPSVAPSDVSTAVEGSASVDEEAFEDISDEVEVISASETVSDDEGFMTDEEYDILDASDEETIVSRN